jgi:hypothetical protein
VLLSDEWVRVFMCGRVVGYLGSDWGRGLWGLYLNKVEFEEDVGLTDVAVMGLHWLRLWGD